MIVVLLTHLHRHCCFFFPRHSGSYIQGIGDFGTGRYQWRSERIGEGIFLGFARDSYDECIDRSWNKAAFGIQVRSTSFALHSDNLTMRRMRGPGRREIFEVNGKRS